MAKKTIQEFITANFGDKAKIFYRFPILQHAWELDSEAYIVETPQGKKLVLTNHGDPFVAKESHLEERLNTYRQVTTATTIALDILRNT